MSTTPSPIRPLPWLATLSLALATTACPTGSPPTGETQLRTPIRSFNRVWQAALKDGDVWFKRQGAPDSDWIHFGRPIGVKALTAISVDDQALVAVDGSGRLFTVGRDIEPQVALQALIPTERFLLDPDMFRPQCGSFCPIFDGRWGNLWLHPEHRLPPHTLAWSLSVVSPLEDKYYLDAADQYQIVGGANVTTVFALADVPEGSAVERSWARRIVVLDPWLPPDYSYELALPKEGRFKATNLSASGSTVFVINDYGDMWTRLWDFDISGADDKFFPSDYAAGVRIPGEVAVFRPPGLEGDQGLLKVKLPIRGWDHQPRIVAQPGEEIVLSRRISIHKNPTHGCLDRTLRVVGTRNGETGYFEKAAHPVEGTWTFVPAPVRPFEPIQNVPPDPSHDGPEELFPYIAAVGDATVRVDRFNPYLSPADLTISVGGAALSAKLHSVDGLRGPATRSRGVDDVVRDMKGALEIESIPSEASAEGLRTFLTAQGLGEGFNRVALAVTGRTLGLRSTEGGPLAWSLESTCFAADRRAAAAHAACNLPYSGFEGLQCIQRDAGRLLCQADCAEATTCGGLDGSDATASAVYLGCVFPCAAL